MEDGSRRRCVRRWPPQVADLAVTVTIDVQAALPDRLNEATLASLTSFVLRREGATGDWTLAFRFTTDPDIQRLHHQFMRLDSPTDIMTFPYAGWDNSLFVAEEAQGAGGDIVISVEQASKQAAEARWTLFDELLFLSIHGTLHLLGWEDRDSRSRDAMLGRQGVLLREWKASTVPL